MIPLIWLAIIITIIGIIYIVSPIDLLPDFIPILGWADDAFVGFIILLAWLFWIFTELIVGYWWVFLIILGIIALYIVVKIKKWWK